MCSEHVAGKGAGGAGSAGLRTIARASRKLLHWMKREGGRTARDTGTEGG